MVNRGKVDRGKQSNMSISMNETEINQIDNLVQFFQEDSINTVTRVDVVKYLLKTAHHHIQNEDVNNTKDFMTTYPKM
ncbi:hypothetical protein [Geomicrobium sp. JCM 19055]|uniref:hypothetical protein n=1 Tax=Geomicrobium sp. JCM 19055 TaxID=1460649 RepID=UPI0005A828E9|nr:hypothetical protein [Geomicrobium sp. JCM 19055]